MHFLPLLLQQVFEKHIYAMQPFPPKEMTVHPKILIQCHLDKVFYDENSISYAFMH